MTHFEKVSAAVSADRMRAIEEAGSAIGISKIVMMENAGNAIARFVVDSIGRGPFDPSDKGKTATILGITGVGNNGGDVFVALRHLAYYCGRFRIKLLLVGSDNDIRSDEARANWNILKKIREIEIQSIQTAEDIDQVATLISSADLILAGIFGTGFRGVPRKLQQLVIELINRREQTCYCVSADLPSGMEADSGISNYAVRSDATITMHAAKIGMETKEAESYTGKIVVANIGIPCISSQSSDG
jgi:hydroxyethylthiazole kinase-like uncharacterized protein yjeF